MLLVESFLDDVANDPDFPEIKKGSRKSFENILKHKKYSPSPNYRSTNAEPDAQGNFERYSISHQLNVTPTNIHYEDDTKNRRKMKQAFMLTADHDWFKNNVACCFWYGWTKSVTVERLPYILQSACKKYAGGQMQNFETSAVGYVVPGGKLPKSTDRLTLSHDFGFEIKGRITYAVDGDAWANERSRAHPVVKSYYANSGRFGTANAVKDGIPIRPGAFRFPEEEVVLSAAQLREPIIAEVIVDRFVVEACVINLDNIKTQQRNNDPRSRALMAKLLQEIQKTGGIEGVPVKTVGRMWSLIPD